MKPFSSIDEWFMERRAKFTSSENYKLLKDDKQGQTFGAGAWTYIEQKAVEHSSNMWERPELDEVSSLLYGKVHEFPAYEWYIRATRNNNMQYVGTETPIFLEDEDIKGEAGGSPDGVSITASFSVDLGLENKCPKNPVLHFRRLLWKDQWDLKQHYVSCYTQIQDLLRITKAPEWHFLSFDDRQKNFKDKGKIIIVYPEKKFIDNLELRIRKAVDEKYKMLKERSMI